MPVLPPTVVVQNLEPNDASYNEREFRLILRDAYETLIDTKRFVVMRPRAMEFPVDSKSGQNVHALLYFDTAMEAYDAAYILDGGRFGWSGSILRAVALVEDVSVKHATPEKRLQTATESVLKGIGRFLTRMACVEVIE